MSDDDIFMPSPTAGAATLNPVQKERPAGPPPVVHTPGGLTRDEWKRLQDLVQRVDHEAYHVVLGLVSDVSIADVKHRLAVLNEWLSHISKRPNLNGEERAALKKCRDHLPMAEWVLTHPRLGEQYLSAVRAQDDAATSTKK